jgi:hypothetical protein
MGLDKRRSQWASRSQEREFEQVILVEVQIAEMLASDCSRPKDYDEPRSSMQRSKEQRRPFFGESGEVHAKRV